MSLQKTVRPLRATAVRIQLPPPHSREIVVQPYSLGQGAACLALDPAPDDPPESPRERLARLAQQTRILLGPEHAALVDVLTVDQCTEIVRGLYLAGAGIDPTDFAEVQRHLREQRESKRTSAELLEQIDALTIELAADLKRLPSEVEGMPMTGTAPPAPSSTSNLVATKPRFFAVWPAPSGRLPPASLRRLSCAARSKTCSRPGI